MNKTEQEPPEDNDDWEERYADPWNMSHKALNKLGKIVTLLALLLACGIYGPFFYSKFAGKAEKRVGNHQAPPFTWPPPETYDSSSLKR